MVSNGDQEVNVGWQAQLVAIWLSFGRYDEGRRKEGKARSRLSDLARARRSLAHLSVRANHASGLADRVRCYEHQHSSTSAAIVGNHCKCSTLACQKAPRFPSIPCSLLFNFLPPFRGVDPRVADTWIGSIGSLKFCVSFLLTPFLDFLIFDF